VRAGDSMQIDVHGHALNLHADGLDHAVREFLEVLVQPQFVEQAQRAGVHGVTAEVAEEVGVLLHHRDLDARAGQQQAQHHARGSTTGDQARRRLLCCLLWGRHDVDRRVDRVSGILNWWDGVELWLSGLGFVAQTAVVMPVVLLLAYGVAVLLDGALGNGIRVLRRAIHADEDES
jgi:hypothetical protein